MGYQVPRKTAKLEFVGDEFEGMEIECALDLTLDEEDHLQELRDESKLDEKRADGKLPSTADKTKAKKAAIAMIDYVADRIVLRWNLVDADDNPLEVSGKTFRSGFPSWFGLKVLNGWGAAVKQASSVPDPLEPPSSDGKPVDLAASSTSLTSSQERSA